MPVWLPLNAARFVLNIRTITLVSFWLLAAGVSMLHRSINLIYDKPVYDRFKYNYMLYAPGENYDSRWDMRMVYYQQVWYTADAFVDKLLGRKPPEIRELSETDRFNFHTIERLTATMNRDLRLYLGNNYKDLSPAEMDNIAKNMGAKDAVEFFQGWNYATLLEFMTANVATLRQAQPQAKQTYNPQAPLSTLDVHTASMDDLAKALSADLTTRVGRGLISYEVTASDLRHILNRMGHKDARTIPTYADLYALVLETGGSYLYRNYTGSKVYGEGRSFVLIPYVNERNYMKLLSDDDIEVLRYVSINKFGYASVDEYLKNVSPDENVQDTVKMWRTMFAQELKDANVTTGRLHLEGFVGNAAPVTPGDKGATRPISMIGALLTGVATSASTLATTSALALGYSSLIGMTGLGLGLGAASFIVGVLGSVLMPAVGIFFLSQGIRIAWSERMAADGRPRDDVNKTVIKDWTNNPDVLDMNALTPAQRQTYSLKDMAKIAFYDERTGKIIANWARLSYLPVSHQRSVFQHENAHRADHLNRQKLGLPMRSGLAGELSAYWTQVRQLPTVWGRQTLIVLTSLVGVVTVAVTGLASLLPALSANVGGISAALNGFTLHYLGGAAITGFMGILASWMPALAMAAITGAVLVAFRKIYLSVQRPILDPQLNEAQRLEADAAGKAFLKNVAPVVMGENFVSIVWGGKTWIKQLKGLQPNDQTVAESWEVSGHVDHPTPVAVNGKRTTLAQLLKRAGARLVGKQVWEEFGNDFPLLIKLLDANDNLSVQVHPQQEYSQLHEGQFGKNEAWVITSADPGAVIYLGFKQNVVPAEFKAAVEQGQDLTPYLNAFTVKPGEVYLVPAGTIHAIGKGVRLAEVQQSSGITYRVWDWNRLPKRELHVEKAMDVLNFNATTKASFTQAPVTLRQEGKSVYTEVMVSDYFRIRQAQVDGTLAMTTEGNFHTLTVLSGKAVLKHKNGTQELGTGQSVVVPAELGAYTLEGKAEIVQSLMPAKMERVSRMDEQRTLTTADKELLRTVYQNGAISTAVTYPLNLIRNLAARAVIRSMIKPFLLFYTFIATSFLGVPKTEAYLDGYQAQAVDAFRAQGRLKVTTHHADWNVANYESFYRFLNTPFKPGDEAKVILHTEDLDVFLLPEFAKRESMPYEAKSAQMALLERARANNITILIEPVRWEYNRGAKAMHEDVERVRAWRQAWAQAHPTDKVMPLALVYDAWHWIHEGYPELFDKYLQATTPGEVDAIRLQILHLAKQEFANAQDMIGWVHLSNTSNRMYPNISLQHGNALFGDDTMIPNLELLRFIRAQRSDLLQKVTLEVNPFYFLRALFGFERSVRQAAKSEGEQVPVISEQEAQRQAPAIPAAAEVTARAAEALQSETKLDENDLRMMRTLYANGSVSTMILYPLSLMPVFLQSAVAALIRPFFRTYVFLARVLFGITRVEVYADTLQIDKALTDMSRGKLNLTSIHTQQYPFPLWNVFRLLRRTWTGDQPGKLVIHSSDLAQFVELVRQQEKLGTPDEAMRFILQLADRNNVRLMIEAHNDANFRTGKAFDVHAQMDYVKQARETYQRETGRVAPIFMLFDPWHWIHENRPDLFAAYKRAQRPGEIAEVRAAVYQEVVAAFDRYVGIIDHLHLSNSANMRWMPSDDLRHGNAMFGDDTMIPLLELVRHINARRPDLTQKATLEFNPLYWVRSLFGFERLIRREAKQRDQEPPQGPGAGTGTTVVGTPGAQGQGTVDSTVQELRRLQQVLPDQADVNTPYRGTRFWPLQLVRYILASALFANDAQLAGNLNLRAPLGALGSLFVGVLSLVRLAVVFFMNETPTQQVVVDDQHPILNRLKRQFAIDEPTARQYNVQQILFRPLAERGMSGLRQLVSGEDFGAYAEAGSRDAQNVQHPTIYVPARLLVELSKPVPRLDNSLRSVMDRWSYRVNAFLFATIVSYQAQRYFAQTRLDPLTEAMNPVLPAENVDEKRAWESDSLTTGLRASEWFAGREKVGLSTHDVITLAENWLSEVDSLKQGQMDESLLQVNQQLQKQLREGAEPNLETLISVLESTNAAEGTRVAELRQLAREARALAPEAQAIVANDLLSMLVQSQLSKPVGAPVRGLEPAMAGVKQVAVLAMPATYKSLQARVNQALAALTANPALALRATGLIQRLKMMDQVLSASMNASAGTMAPLDVTLGAALVSEAALSAKAENAGFVTIGEDLGQNRHAAMTGLLAAHELQGLPVATRKVFEISSPLKVELNNAMIQSGQLPEAIIAREYTGRVAEQIKAPAKGNVVVDRALLGGTALLPQALAARLQAALLKNNPLGWAEVMAQKVGVSSNLTDLLQSPNSALGQVYLRFTANPTRLNTQKLVKAMVRVLKAQRTEVDRLAAEGYIAQSTALLGEHERSVAAFSVVSQNLAVLNAQTIGAWDSTPRSVAQKALWVPELLSQPGNRGALGALRDVLQKLPVQIDRAWFEKQQRRMFRSTAQAA